MHTSECLHRRFLQSMSLALLLLGLSACQGETDPSQPGYWVARLKDKPTRVEALKELAKMGPAAKEAVPAVTQWLKEGGDWQPDAAYTLGQIGDASVVGELRAAIDYEVSSGRDRSTRLRNRVNQNIARALAALGAKDAVGDLIKLVDSPEPKTRDAVLRTLGELGAPEAAESMMEIAENDAEPYIRKVAISSLGELGSEKAVPTLVKMLYAERGDGISHYREARFALIQTGAKAVPELMKTLERKNETIEQMKVGGAPLSDGVIAAKAGSALGALRVKDAEAPMVAALQKYYNQWQRTKSSGAEASVLGAVIELTYALGDLGNDGAMTAILEVVPDTDPRIRLAATEALTTIGDPAAVPALLAAAKSGELDAKRAAVIAASQLGDGSRLSTFDALGTGELEPFVKAERVRLLAAKECNSDAACWQGKLGSDDARIAARAAFQLGRLGAKDAAKALLDAAEHDNPQVRMAAVLSLEQLSAVDVARFESILEDASKRVEYAPVNAQMERIIALRGGTKS